MIKRELGKTGIMVSEVGLGCEHLEGKSAEVVAEVVSAAIDAGINLFDVFMSEPQVRSNIGAAIASRRGQVVLQGHIGSAWIDGQYTHVSSDLALCKTYFEDFMSRLSTDYVDIGMLHFVDNAADYDALTTSGVLDYALSLKKSGVIRAVGMSTHNPAVAQMAAESGHIDCLLFSLNPAYDMLPASDDIEELFSPESYKSEKPAGMDKTRELLYKTCASRGVGIVVMKGLGAGALLSADTSPFAAPLSPAQCIHYALCRPGVSSIVVGCKTPDEVRAAVAYESATDEERDYSLILSRSPKYSMQGRCMYCNHCLPCPAKIDIAQVGKYLDLALISGTIPPTVREHYAALSATARDCTACGACEERCPFGVSVVSRMEKTRELFGEL